MIILRSQTRVAGMSAEFLERFMLRCDDGQYQRWWPGVHLQFHMVESKPGFLGGKLWMDEYIGKRRVALEGYLEEIVAGRRLIWRMAYGVRLPARLILEYTDEAGVVEITHTIQAGFSGIGAILDPLLRLYFSPVFARAMDAHMHEEFQRLKDVFLPDAPLRPPLPKGA
jgi:hypothetical protein